MNTSKLLFILSMCFFGSINCASSQVNSSVLCLSSLKSRADLFLKLSNESMIIGDINNARRYKIMAISLVSTMLLEQARRQIVANINREGKFE